MSFLGGVLGFAVPSSIFLLGSHFGRLACSTQSGSITNQLLFERERVSSLKFSVRVLDQELGLRDRVFG